LSICTEVKVLVENHKCPTLHVFDGAFSALTLLVGRQDERLARSPPSLKQTSSEQWWLSGG